MDTSVIDQAKLETFVMRAVGDLSAGYGGVMVSLGSQARPVQGDGRRRPAERQRSSLRAPAAPSATCASGSTRRRRAATSRTTPSATPTSCTPSRRWCWPTRTARVYIPHAWNVPASMWFDEHKALEAFRTGKGVAWGEHDGRLSCGVAAFYRNAYRASLRVRVAAGARRRGRDSCDAGIAVADVGCGHGHSTVLMAEAFPNSRFHGFDAHAASIDDGARATPSEAGVAARAHFDDRARGRLSRAATTASSASSTALHDMGDPVAAARHAAEVLAPGGTVMLVEPFANDRVEDNISPVGAAVLRGLDHDLLRPRDLRGRQAGARRAGGRGAPGRRVPQGRASRTSAVRPRRRST